MKSIREMFPNPGPSFKTQNEAIEHMKRVGFFAECRKLDRTGYAEMYDWMREKLTGPVYSHGMPLNLNEPALPGSLCVGHQSCAFSFVVEKDALEFALTWS